MVSHCIERIDTSIFLDQIMLSQKPTIWIVGSSHSLWWFNPNLRVHVHSWSHTVFLLNSSPLYSYSNSWNCICTPSRWADLNVESRPQNNWPCTPRPGKNWSNPKARPSHGTKESRLTQSFWPARDAMPCHAAWSENNYRQVKKTIYNKKRIMINNYFNIFLK